MRIGNRKEQKQNPFLFLEKQIGVRMANTNISQDELIAANSLITNLLNIEGCWIKKYRKFVVNPAGENNWTTRITEVDEKGTGNPYEEALLINAKVSLGIWFFGNVDGIDVQLFGRYDVKKKQFQIVSMSYQNSAEIREGAIISTYGPSRLKRAMATLGVAISQYKLFFVPLE